MNIAKQKHLEKVESFEAVKKNFPRSVDTKRFGRLYFDINESFELCIVINDVLHVCYLGGSHSGDVSFHVGKKDCHFKSYKLDKTKYAIKSEVGGLISKWVLHRSRLLKKRGDDVFKKLFQSEHRDIPYKGYHYYMYRSNRNYQIRHLFSVERETGVVYILECNNIIIPKKFLTDRFDMEYLSKLKKTTLITAGFMDEEEMIEYRKFRYQSLVEEKGTDSRLLIPKHTALLARSGQLIMNFDNFHNNPFSAVIGRWCSLRYRKGLVVPRRYILSYAISM